MSLHKKRACQAEKRVRWGLWLKIPVHKFTYRLSAGGQQPGFRTALADNFGQRQDVRCCQEFSEDNQGKWLLPQQLHGFLYCLGPPEGKPGAIQHHLARRQQHRGRPDVKNVFIDDHWFRRGRPTFRRAQGSRVTFRRANPGSRRVTDCCLRRELEDDTLARLAARGGSAVKISYWIYYQVAIGSCAVVAAGKVV